MKEPELNPVDLLAEKAVLRCILVAPDKLPEVAARLLPEHFGSPRHRLVYEACLDLVGEFLPCDLVHVVKRMKIRGTLEAAGGAGEVSALTEAQGLTTLASEYANRVIEGYATRDTIRRLVGLTADVSTYGPESVAGAINDIRAGLEAAIGGRTLRTSGEVGRALVERMASVYEQGARPYLPTGFKAIDMQIGGLRAGQLLVLAGRPSMGKTTLAMDIAGNVARGGGAVLVASLETEAETLEARLAAREANVSAQRIMSGDGEGYELERFTPALVAVAGWPITWDDAGRAGVRNVEAAARRLMSAGPLSLIVVDHLGLIDADDEENGNRQQVVAKISRGLKSMAMVLRVPVLACCQLNRKAESREGNRPTMSDLRDSGAIEQDADVVALLYREDYYSRDGERTGKVEVNIAKQRFGPTGTVTLSFESHIPRFVDEEEL